MAEWLMACEMRPAKHAKRAKSCDRVSIRFSRSFFNLHILRVVFLPLLVFLSFSVVSFERKCWTQYGVGCVHLSDFSVVKNPFLLLESSRS